MISVLALFTLLGAVAAQNTTVPTTVASSVVAGVVANFQNAQITPQLFTTFNPQGTLEFNFGNGSVSTGTPLAQTAVQTFPTLTIYAETNATSLFSNASLYTVGMVDALTVGTDETTTQQVRHWLVNSVGLSGAASPYTLNFTGATTITDYAGPAPPAGSGPHRYIFVLYAQPSTFSAPANLTAGSGVGRFFFTQYVQQAGLGNLLAANYYTVESGTNSSIPVTSAVVTSTLAGYSSGASGTVRATSSGSGTVSSSAAATTSARSGAGKRELGWGMVLGAAGVVGCVVGAGVGL